MSNTFNIELYISTEGRHTVNGVQVPASSIDWDALEIRYTCPTGMVYRCEREEGETQFPAEGCVYTLECVLLVDEV